MSSNDSPKLLVGEHVSIFESLHKLHLTRSTKAQFRKE